MLKRFFLTHTHEGSKRQTRTPFTSTTAVLRHRRKCYNGLTDLAHVSALLLLCVIFQQPGSHPAVSFTLCSHSFSCSRPPPAQVKSSQPTDKRKYTKKESLHRFLNSAKHDYQAQEHIQTVFSWYCTCRSLILEILHMVVVSFGEDTTDSA